MGLSNFVFRWPKVVGVDNPIRVGADNIRRISPRQLSVKQQRILWEGIKSVDPNLAEVLANDANIQALKKQFGATPIFEAADFNRYIQAGTESVAQRGRG